MSVINIKQKLSKFDDHWSPKIVGEMNDDYNMLFVRFESLKELDITPEDVCFNKGVNTIIQKLGVDISHSQNLHTARLRYTKHAPI